MVKNLEENDVLEVTKSIGQRVLLRTAIFEENHSSCCHSTSCCGCGNDEDQNDGTPPVRYQSTETVTIDTTPLVNTA